MSQRSPGQAGENRPAGRARGPGSHPPRLPGVSLAALAVGFLLAASCAPTAATIDAPTLRLVDDRIVEVSGLTSRTLDRIAALPDAERAGILAVRTLAADHTAGAPAMLGMVRIEGNRLVFRPRFPFAAGASFIARYTPPHDAEASELEFAVRPPDGLGDTRVATVYPSADVWPMNQLKMYVHFSAPMRAGAAFEHIRLIDRSDDSEVEQPFVTVQEELWDRDRTVLTVLYDPARIKRGLAPHLEAGLPLQAGGAYRLLIDAAWPDAEGRPLAASFMRDFRIAEPDRTAPDPTRWHLEVPDAGTRDPLTLLFDEPLDHGLLRSLIGIRRAPPDTAAGEHGWRVNSRTTPGDEVFGTVEITDDERALHFRPQQPWIPGAHEIVVPTILEDLAGNTLRGLFDAEVGGASTAFSGAEAAYHVFEVRQRAAAGG